jgi:Restriction endonuclease
MDRLYERYSSLVSSLFASRIPAEDIEDAVNDTFAAALADRDSAAGLSESEMGAWLCCHVRDQFRSYLGNEAAHLELPIDTAALQDSLWDGEGDEIPWEDGSWDRFLFVQSPDTAEQLTQALLDTNPGVGLEGVSTRVSPSDAPIFSAFLSHAQQAERLGVSLGQLLAPFSDTTLLGPDGEPLSGDGALALQLSAKSVTTEVLDLLATKPQLLHSLTPRQFEEVMAELFARQGYDVTLTAATKDGGADLFVLDNKSLGSMLYVVECKKYRADRPVGVGVVRGLFGVVQSSRATAGILATTSYFTRGAKEYQRDLRYQLSLRDFAQIQGWLLPAT